MEIWKDIKGYKDIYQVSNMGRVKSICRMTNCNNPITKSRYKGRISAKQKPVKCFSLNGKFIEEFDNITIAAYKTKSHRENISKCCKGIYNKTNNLIFKYA